MMVLHLLMMDMMLFPFPVIDMALWLLEFTWPMGPVFPIHTGNDVWSKRGLTKKRPHRPRLSINDNEISPWWGRKPARDRRVEPCPPAVHQAWSTLRERKRRAAGDGARPTSNSSEVGWNIALEASLS